MEYHRISFIHNDTEYSFIKAINGNLTGYALMSACRIEVVNDTEYSFVKAMSSSLTGYALVTACRAEVTIYMKENNLKGYYILTGMAKV